MSATTATAIPIRFMRLPQVMQIVPLSRSRIFELVGQGKFPAPIKLSQRASAWTEASILAWCAERLAQSRKEAA